MSVPQAKPCRRCESVPGAHIFSLLADSQGAKPPPGGGGAAPPPPPPPTTTTTTTTRLLSRQMVAVRFWAQCVLTVGLFPVLRGSKVQHLQTWLGKPAKNVGARGVGHWRSVVLLLEPHAVSQATPLRLLPLPHRPTRSSFFLMCLCLFLRLDPTQSGDWGRDRHCLRQHPADCALCLLFVGRAVHSI